MGDNRKCNLNGICAGITKEYCDDLKKGTISTCKARGRYMSVRIGKVVTMRMSSLKNSHVLIPDGTDSKLQIMLKIVWELSIGEQTICKTESKMINLDINDIGDIREKKAKLVEDAQNFIKDTSIRLVSLKNGDKEHEKIVEDDYWTDKLLKAYIDINSL